VPQSSHHGKEKKFLLNLPIYFTLLLPLIDSLSEIPISLKHLIVVYYLEICNNEWLYHVEYESMQHHSLVFLWAYHTLFFPVITEQ
jgi:hypothetical protein